MYDYTKYLDPWFHRPLARLGHHDWFEWVYLPAKPGQILTSAIQVRSDVVDRYADEDGLQVVNDVLANRDGGALQMFCIHSRILAQGPKVIRPDLETCLAMEALDIDLPVADYVQPYEALIIEPSPAWVDRIMARDGLTTRYESMIVYWNAAAGMIALTLFQPVARETRTIKQNLYERPEFATIEAQLGYQSVREPDMEIGLARSYMRLALNVGLMMTHYGTRTVGWLDPRATLHQKRAAPKKKKKGPKGAEPDPRAAMLALRDIREVGFAQDLRLYNVVNLAPPGDGHPGAGGGFGQGPHWRRGHWRNQAHGPKMSLHKRILIKPTFVAMARFAGDLAATSAVYHLDAPRS